VDLVLILLFRPH